MAFSPVGAEDRFPVYCSGRCCVCLVIANLPAAACLLQEAPVWEITGAEFSKSEMHTADGISIRFPRMTRIRDDKDWKSATNLHQLRVGQPPHADVSFLKPL